MPPFLFHHRHRGLRVKKREVSHRPTQTHTDILAERHARIKEGILSVSVCVRLWLKLICCREELFYCRRNRQERYLSRTARLIDKGCSVF